MKDNGSRFYYSRLTDGEKNLYDRICEALLRFEPALSIHAGMGKAFEIMQKEGASDAARMNELRNYLIGALSLIEGCHINGSTEHHVPGILSVSFEGIDGKMLLPSLTAVAASAGSACSSSELKPSYILKAVGLTDELAMASLRLSLGRFSTMEEMKTAAADIAATVARLRHGKK